MVMEKTSLDTGSVPVQKLTSLVGRVLGVRIGYEDPDNPAPPGPWDPVIGNALTQTALRLGPASDPGAINSVHSQIPGALPGPHSSIGPP